MSENSIVITNWFTCFPKQTMYRRLCLVLFCLLVISFANAQNCSADLNALRNRTYDNHWLLFDATGKGDYGYYQPFSGYFDPGKWTVCHSRKNAESGPAEYCYMHLNASKDQSSDPAHKISFTVAACVPASCTAEELNSLPALSVQESLHLPEIYATGYVADCKASSYDIPWGTYVFVTVIVILAILVILGTLIDAQITNNIIPLKIPFLQIEHDSFEEESLLKETKKDQQPKKEKKLEDKHPLLAIRILLSFSFLYNYSRLISPPAPGNFDALNGVRVICMMFVVVGHTFYFFWDTMAVMNFQSVAETVQLFRFQIIVAGFYAVDTFFFMSGFLVAYLFIKELQSKGLSFKMMFMFYFHRIYRLTPSLIVGMFFFYLITPYWSDGPYWPIYQDFVISRCSTGWWYTILYVQNLVDPSHLCMGWSWYLADDMQYYVLSPIVLIAYWKNKYLGWFLTFLGIIVCMATNLGICLANDIQNFPLFQAGAEIGNYIPPGGKYGALIYLPPWTRVSPYLVGFLCAFILVERGTSFRVTPVFRTIIYINSFIIIFILSFITWSDSNYGWSNWMNTLWITVCRPVWSVGLGALLVLCVIGYGGVFSALMSRPFWVPLARLSYGAYIYHLSNLASIYCGYKSGVTYTFETGLYFFFGHLLIAFMLAFANFFLVEKPLMNLETLILHRQPRAKSS